MKTSVAMLALCLLYLPVTKAFYVHEHILDHPCDQKFKDLETRMAEAEKRLELLKKENAGKRVAFGASLGDVRTIGPFKTRFTLTYKHVYANTGSYDPATGIFTAPVKGIYYFSFSGHYYTGRAMGLRLMKNEVQMVSVYNHPSGTNLGTAGNGMTLQLEVGDQVYMILWGNTWIYDNVNNHSTFIGYLLFPL